MQAGCWSVVISTPDSISGVCYTVIAECQSSLCIEVQAPGVHKRGIKVEQMSEELPLTQEGYEREREEMPAVFYKLESFKVVEGNNTVTCYLRLWGKNWVQRSFVTVYEASCLLKYLALNTELAFFSQ